MIYLASTSPRRKRILKELGLKFKTIKPDYHENPIKGLAPSKLVCRHAEEKARSCFKKIRNGLIIGADTIVVYKGKVIGKPKDMADAVRTLRLLQGQWHAVYTGVALCKVRSRKIVSTRVFFESTKIKLKALNLKEIKRYLKKINPLDKAGSYAIQSKLSIVKSIKGSFTNAVGLPVEVLCDKIKLQNKKGLYER